MGYHFKREESIARNLNRILSEQVQAAIDSLENPGESKEETIHGVRKGIKKIRALLRLVRSELKAEVFQRENAFYRQIGHTLAPLRDATVMINTLEKLQQTHPAAISSQVFLALREALTQQQERASREFFQDGTQMRELIDTFRQASRKIPGLSKSPRSFSVFAPNLKGIYRRARKALQVARRKPSIDHFHELRKEVKALWYHKRLLSPIWPGLFDAYGQELGRLGELLGEDHDYGVLAEEIESERLVLVNQPTKEALLQLLEEHRINLQRQIHPLANRLLAQKAGAFVETYRLYWKLWQAEAKKLKTSVEL